MISLFAKPLVVELPPTKTLNPEHEAQIASLADHVGFTALMDRLAVQKALLETKLKNERHSDIRAVDALQLGIQWIHYLQGEVDRRVYKRVAARNLKADLEQADELDRIRRSIERIAPQGQQ